MIAPATMTAAAGANTVNQFFLVISVNLLRRSKVGRNTGGGACASAGPTIFPTSGCVGTAYCVRLIYRMPNEDEDHMRIRGSASRTGFVQPVF
jgi:hypothetical protein